MSEIFGTGTQKPTVATNVRTTQSSLGLAVPAVLGTAQVHQSLVWMDGFLASKVNVGGKNGKAGNSYIYSANVLAGLCSGPVLGLGDVWSNQSWLGIPTAYEAVTIPSGSDPTYTPIAGTPIIDAGASLQNTFSGSYSDVSAPSPTVLSGSDFAPMIRVGYGTTLTTGLYAIDNSGNYHFSPADSGKSAQVSYSHNTITSTETETDLIPSGRTITVGSPGVGTGTFGQDYGVVYATGPNEGVALSKVSGTPTATGTYQLVNNSPATGQATYHFATGDVSAEVRVTFATNDATIIPQGQSAMLNYTLIEGYPGQATWSLLISTYPGAALGYTSLALVAYNPMKLGASAQVTDNRFEVVTADAWGSGIYDCNPVQCLRQVLTNTVWGLGSGKVPFPAGVIDNGTTGTWGSSNPLGGLRVTESTARSWFAANNFFISPVIDQQDTAASVMNKWLEAGMCAAFMSEGVLKLVPYGDTSAAANGCTWVAPQQYDAALDDNCFIAKEGEDPVKLTSGNVLDGWNSVQVQWNNRSNQYAPEVTEEYDQAAIDKYGVRREDPQNFDFIHTLPAAQFSANMRVKRSVYITNSNTYEFTLPFTYGYLEPMSIVTISTTSSWAAGLNNGAGIFNRPVRITKVVDDPEKGLQITAEDYPFGAHQPTINNKGIAQADVVSNAYADPGQSEVVMFEANNRLTLQQGNQIWFGICGTSANYGGTNIYASADGGSTYDQIGTVQTPARMGTLAAAFPSGSDPDTVNSLVVNMAENTGPLNAGSTSDADNLVNEAYVDGEVIGFSACTVTGQNQYTISSYIRRGQMGTTVGSHAANSVFVMLDTAIWKYAFDPSWIGKTVYFKFQSFNAFGNNPQPLSSLTPVTFTIQGTYSGAVDQASGLIIPFAQSSNNPVIPNANFEMPQLPVPGWRAVSGTTTVAPISTGLTQVYETANPQAGKQSLKLTALSAYMGLISTTKIAVTPGDVWKLSGYVNNYGTAQQADLAFYCMDKTGTRTGFLPLNNNAADSTWHFASGQFTVPANSVYAFVYCRVDSIGSAGFDGIQLVRVSSMDDEVQDGGTFVRLLGSHASGNVAYNFRGVWNSGASYVTGDETVYGQSYWLALAANTNSAPSTSNANWQVIGSYSGYQGAWSSITAYVAGAEVTYGGNYWACVTANTNSAPSTSNANWQIAGPANLDNIADGGVYLRTSYVAGDVLVENGNFEASTTILPPPGYHLYGNTVTLAYDTTTQYSGAQSIKLTTPSGGGGGIAPIRPVMCRPGDTFFASARAKVVSGSGNARVSISFRNASFGGIGGADAITASSSWVLLTNTQTAPAGTVYATFEIYADAASMVAEFDEHYVRCVRNLDTEVANGTQFAKTSANLSLENMLQDPGFEATPIGSTPNAWTGLGAIGLVTTPGQSGAASDHCLETPSISGYTGVWTVNFPCLPGEQYIFSGNVKSVGGTGTWDDYFQTFQTDGVTQVTNSGQSISGVNTSTWSAFSQTYTIPAGAYYFNVGIVNAGSADRALIDNVSLRKVRSLDSEVMDGTTFGRVHNTALTSNNVDPSKSGLLMKGVLPPTLSGGFSYTATPSQIIVSWNNMTLYRADGTSTSIGSGSQTISGLLQNTIYNLYPYWDEVASTLNWVGTGVAFPNIAGVHLQRHEPRSHNGYAVFSRRSFQP